VKQLTGNVSPSLTVIKDDHGRLLTEKDDVLQRWKNYCEHLYEDEDESTKPALALSEQEPPPLKSEIAWAVKHTSTGKAPGSDVTVELLKGSGDTAVELIQKIRNEV